MKVTIDCELRDGFRMTISYKEVSEIIGLIDASSSCEELVLETDQIKLVVRRRGAGGANTSAPLPMPAASSSRPASAPQSATSHISKSPITPAATDGVHVVTSPMVGTFYRAPSPEAPPFVEVGSKVNVGDPLCIIEVMKLFTTINSEVSGIVREIGAENAKLVEFGQMLFVIEPD